MDADGSTRLARIFNEASACTRCSSMPGCPRTLGPSCGDASARCLVVGEAPGHAGALRTGRPLSGDRTGASFDQLLTDAGIGRPQLFITNAVLCAASDGSGQPRRPTRRELDACSGHLASLIACIDPGLVVTLGTSALDAVGCISAHRLRLSHAVGRAHRWDGRFLLPLYHPGARAMISRPLSQQRRDYALWASLIS